MSAAARLEEVSYHPDGAELFARLRDLPGAVFLDSGRPHADTGRYDILAALPREAAPDCPPATAGEHAFRGYFDDLRAFHREQFAGISHAAANIPFCGGVLGYLGYHCGEGLHAVRRDTQHDSAELPATRLFAYDGCLVQDHLLRRAFLVSLPGQHPARRREMQARLRTLPPPSAGTFALHEPFRSDLTPADYRAAFEQVQAYIRAGDCYQVNLAQCFRAPYQGDPWQAYRRLRRLAAAPFSAFLSLGGKEAVLSLSPERFLSLHGQRVETSPIKGTRPRHADPAADRRAAAELQAAEKDRAENLMIVDLLRNDLGRNCTPGSIHVDQLFEVQSFPAVHHLVSTITGELRADRSAWELLRDSFPGGSITGAPKRRAMQVIAELEAHPRQTYCGSILYISADGRMDSNIAIRTLLCRGGEVSCWGGGGIVADSECEKEYRETFDKVGGFLAELETPTD